MGTPAEVTLTLNEESGAFASVDRKPDNNDLSKIRSALISTLIIAVKYDASNNIHKLWGITATDANYLITTSQAVAFVMPPCLILRHNILSQRNICRLPTIEGGPHRQIK